MTGRTIALFFCSFLFAAAGAKAQTYSNLYSFCAQHGCSDGAEPQAGLIADTAGNLYGTTGGGGIDGAVFELSPNGSGGWAYSVIHKFCSQRRCSDGAVPSGPLIIDGAGNLYGVAFGGGKKSAGVAYELIPQGGGQWNLVVLHSFCKQVACIDGAGPSGGLAYLGQRSGAPFDGTSTLYGTTQGGGAYSHGTVYMLTAPPSGGGRSWWKSKVLYSFCPEGGSCLTDGANATSGVVVDSRNVLFGTTQGGGQFASGTLFKLTRSGSTWTKQILHTFCSLKRCADGENPTALAENDAGELIGGTVTGPHKPGCVDKPCGTVFKLAPDTATFTTLYTFCSQTDCADGRSATGPIRILDNGDLVGTATGGGDTSNTSSGGGVLYRLSGATLTVLHDFCGSAGCADGTSPNGGVLVDGKGRMFGTTAAGGDAGQGTIYEFAP